MDYEYPLFKYFDITAKWPLSGESILFVQTSNTLMLNTNTAADNGMMCIDFNFERMGNEEITYWYDKYPALQKTDVVINDKLKQLFYFDTNGKFKLYVFKLTDLGVEVGYHYQKMGTLTTMFLIANPTNEDIEREFSNQPINKISAILKNSKFWYPDKKEYVQRVYDFLKTNFYDLEPGFTNEVNNFLSDYNCKYTPNDIKTENDATNQHNLIGKAENTSTKQADLTDNQKVVLKHIEHLKGQNAMKEKIMSDADFERLFKDLCYLIENNALPTISNPLAQIGVSNQSIIYTLRLIHQELFTTNKIRPSFVEFLQKYFAQLSDIGNMQVTFSKKAPKNYPF